MKTKKNISLSVLMGLGLLFVFAGLAQAAENPLESRLLYQRRELDRSPDLEQVRRNEAVPSTDRPGLPADAARNYKNRVHQAFQLEVQQNGRSYMKPPIPRKTAVRARVDQRGVDLAEQLSGKQKTYRLRYENQ